MIPEEVMEMVREVRRRIGPRPPLSQAQMDLLLSTFGIIYPRGHPKATRPKQS